MQERLPRGRVPTHLVFKGPERRQSEDSQRRKEEKERRPRGGPGGEVNSCRFLEVTPRIRADRAPGVRRQSSH